MICGICQTSEASTDVPILGTVCNECHFELSADFLLEGVVQSQSLLVIAAMMDGEFKRRSDRLRRMAVEVIKQKAVK